MIPDLPVAWPVPWQGGTPGTVAIENGFGVKLVEVRAIDLGLPSPGAPQRGVSPTATPPGPSSYLRAKSAARQPSKLHGFFSPAPRLQPRAHPGLRRLRMPTQWQCPAADPNNEDYLDACLITEKAEHAQVLLHAAKQ